MSNLQSKLNERDRRAKSEAKRMEREHRRTAKRNGISGVQAEDAEAEVKEIVENLARGELTPAEAALHHGRLKQIYETAHPETKHGGDRRSTSRRSSRQVGDSNERYTAEVAKRTAWSERAVQRRRARKRYTAGGHHPSFDSLHRVLRAARAQQQAFQSEVVG
jgi:hypothetical protein